MSTLSGLASKGEKEKASKYQSLDINKLYRVSLGESSENKQQKSTLSQKHGMQSLGKVPNTRRPPANLPSLKSEHSGTDTAVSLVPSNGSGWGKQESTAQTSTTTTVQSTSNSVNASAPISIAGPTLSAHQAAIALPVTTTIQPANKSHPPSASPATNPDKSWSSVMIGNDPNAAHPPPYQSPQFQHEFPSLSAGDGAQPRAATDTGYAPGLSLRPQTEGSWLQGGSRASAELAGARGTSVPPGGPPQHSAQGGQPLPPQVRGFVPNFMFRGGNYPANGHGAPPTGPMLPAQQAPPSAQSARRQDPRHRGGDLDEMAHRPIIKDEDLSGMDNLTGDMGWAINDDIDYNQKLAFSDDELKSENARKVSRTNKDYDKTDTHFQDADHKPSWNNQHSNNQAKPQPRSRHEEDEFTAQRRRQQQEIANAVERAKQRKEEEEKKFLETRQAAAKKLQELDERIGKSKRDKEVDDNCGTINPASVPPQTIAPVPILLPEWERDKDVVVRPKTNPTAQHQHQHHENDEKHKANHRDTDFKHLTQIEGRATFGRKDSRTERSVEKEQPAGGTAQHNSFSKQFQSDLPPRFQKQQQLNAQSSFQYENRWGQSGSRTSPSNRKGRDDEKDLDERYRRQDDGYRPHRYDSGRKSSDSRYEDYSKDYDFKLKDDDKMQRVRDRHEKGDTFDGISISRQSSDEWHGDKRPQRPDSRDSRTSRESRHSGDSTRHSEPREYSSWAEEPIGEKKKEHRMVVPGPITKEKIEADDLRNEKRNLTQLKRGMLDKKLEKSDNDEDSWSIMKKDSIDEPKAWADSIPAAVEKELLKAKDEKRDDDDEKKEKFDRDDKKHPGGRGRSDSQGSRNQGWSGNAQVYRNSWSSNKKNPPPPRSSRGGGMRIKGQDMTESEGSADDAAMPIENGPNAKPVKKIEKDERNKEARSAEKQPIGGADRGDRNKVDKNHFVARGEPSRHGRGAALAGSSFRGSRGGSKRIDTYGPPAKSPFSNIDEKDRKHDEVDEDAKGKSAEDKNRKKMDPRKSKPKQDGDVSDNSDVDGRKSKNSQRSSGPAVTRGGRGGGGAGAPLRPIPPVDKRGFGGPRADLPHRQNSSGNIQRGGLLSKDKDGKDKDNALSSAIADITLKDAEALDIDVLVEDGFQEVKSKKTDRKVEKKDEKPKPIQKSDKDLKKPERPAKTGSQISPQQVANIPSLMATPVNPPANMPQPQSKAPFDRNRQNKTLPPRFAKAKEHNRMQKAQMQQGMCEDLNKVNTGMYGLKDGIHVGSSSMNSNAWEKPLSSQLRVDQDLVVAGMEACKSLESTLHHQSAEDKAVLDGSKPLNTIIFENTNYKSAPGARRGNDKPRNKMEEGIDSLTNFNKPIGELLGKDKSSDIQIQLFNKEDTADMKLDFLESEISQITEDKTSKISLSRSNMNTSNNILTADALNMKIQSVKKVWESNIPNVMEHTNEDSFASSFAPDPNSMDANIAFSKGSEVPDENHDVYNSSPNANSASNSTTNVCKVKPTQQVAGAGGQTLLTGTHQPHSNIVGPALMGHALSSPPPIQPVMGGLGQPPQQYTASQHISYQAGLGSNQYGGLPAPSPPTVMNYSTQQLQQSGLYAPFQIDTSQVINNQGRSQFSGYSFGLGQTASSPYSQSMYLPTGQPHAPPNPQQDLYQNMNNYRMPNTGPFGQNQQLNNPTTVLISSTSNSLMSPSVKPSNQQISAIGTKAGGVGQAYQQQSQQGQQVYIPFDPSITANYMQSAGVIQRGPAGPVQNNVVPGLQPSGLQPSSSFYSGSTGGQTGYFQGPGSSSLPSQMQQHQTGFGLQQSVFPTHNQSHTNAGMQNYPGPYLSSGQMQLAAAAMSQYRSANIQNPQYMKNQIGDQGRQQLKSPGSQQQEVLSSVFNSGSQIASPKSRQQMKQPPPQPSPTAHNKYLYSGMSNQQGGQTRYPTPIQRPAGNYQSQMSNVQNNSGNSNQKPHRMNNSNSRSSGGGGGGGGRQYYGSQGGNMNTQSDKAEESKLSDGVNSSNQSSSGAKPSASSVNQPGEKADAKEENCAKD